MGKKPKGAKTLDLHGYKSDEVVDTLDRFLLECSRKNQGPVRVMTGKGKGVVKKIVTEYLAQAGYPWQYEKSEKDQVNEGVLVVFT